MFLFATGNITNTAVIFHKRLNIDDLFTEKGIPYPKILISFR